MTSFGVGGMTSDIDLYRHMREVVEVAQVENAGNTASSRNG